MEFSVLIEFRREMKRREEGWEERRKQSVDGDHVRKGEQRRPDGGS